MSKTNKTIIAISIIILIITLVVMGIWKITVSLIPPDKERMEQYFQQDKEDLSVVAEYLGGVNGSSVGVDTVREGIMIVATPTKVTEQKIEDQMVLDALNRLLKNKKYKRIGKNENTVYFEKWYFLEQDRGIAVPVNKADPPWVEFLVKSEILSENGWYYYEADYEQWRNDRGRLF